MQGNIQKTNRKEPSKLEQGVIFFFVWMGIAAITFAFFWFIDFLPEKPEIETQTQPQPETASQGVSVEPYINTIQALPDSRDVIDSRDTFPVDVKNDPLPNTITFDSLGKSVTVLNPASDSVEALDNALLSGVVRHPDSADFKQTGTIFLLGHSSYLPTVHNKNFQAFNGIQHLEWGDTIRLRSDDAEYVYSVDRVYEAKASDAMVPLQYSVPKLTLATCNSFGSKDDRFIVEATLVSKSAL